jgi:predicted transcriptional regulator
VTKNLTLAIEDELLDRARIIAAIRRTSVNAMVREFLEREVKRESSVAARMEKWNDRFKASDQNSQRRERRVSGDKPTFDREEFYEEVMRERGLL